LALPVARTPQAREDLVEIWNFIADDSESAADRVLDRIDGALTMLSENPFGGRDRPELGTGIRSFPVGNYIVYYQPQPHQLLLVRVLSGYLDISQDDFGYGIGPDP